MCACACDVTPLSLATLLVATLVVVVAAAVVNAAGVFDVCVDGHGVAVVPAVGVVATIAVVAVSYCCS